MEEITENVSAAKVLFENCKRDYLFYFSRLLNKVMVEPDMIQLMLTSKCNIRCKICDVWKQEFTEQLTTDEVKSLIDQAIDMGIKTIYFTGGEALLRRDIFELINYASHPGIITTVNTNGGFITEAFAKEIVSSKLRNINFSIDGATPEIHNAIRGNNVFEKAIKAIKYINYYKKILHRENTDGEERRLDIAMTSVIMKCNIEELPRLAILAEKMECCYISFQPLVNNGNLLASHNFQTDFWIGEEDIPKLWKVFQELECMKKRYGQIIYIDFMPEKTIQHFKKERTVNTCFAGFSRIFVNPQGDISFVCFSSFGNTKTDKIKDVWYSEKAYEIRKEIKNCRVNCTQFCSERPESESTEIIHRNFLRQINNLPDLSRIDLLKKENEFLQSILYKINDPYVKEQIIKIQNKIHKLID